MPPRRWLLHDYEMFMLDAMGREEVNKFIEETNMSTWKDMVEKSFICTDTSGSGHLDYWEAAAGKFPNYDCFG